PHRERTGQAFRPHHRHADRQPGARYPVIPVEALNAMTESSDYRELLHFWFEETSPAQWWEKVAAFDGLIAARFGALHRRACQCELHRGRAIPEGRLAEIIVLDQFSRNIHRDTPGAFAADPQALALAQEAVAAGADRALTPGQPVLLPRPYLHREPAAIPDTAPALARATG